MKSQATAPADIVPVAQDEGQPVQVGKASDEVPVRGVGHGLSGQSDEFVATCEVVEGTPQPDEAASLSDDLRRWFS